MPQVGIALESKKQQLDWEAVHAKLDGDKKGGYWRSLDELGDTEEHRAWVEDEFPYRKSIPDVDRRTFLKLAGAAAALAGATGCRNLPQSKLVPHTTNPEDRPAGSVQFYATTMPFGGYGFPVLAESHEGRPTKLDGNDLHPASMGASDVFTQAEILNLYDPDRSQNVLNDGLMTTWDEFFTTIKRQLETTKGAKMAVLSGRVTSPTLVSKVESLLAKYPAIKWHQFEAVDNDGELQALGGNVPVYDFSQADVILSLDGDFMAGNPHTVGLAQAFAAKRDPALRERMCRLYAVESAPNNTGAFADHRAPVKPSEVLQMAMAVGFALGLGGFSAMSPPEGISNQFVEAIAGDLRSRRGVVYVGAHQAAEVHAVAHLINQSINAPVSFVTPAEYKPTLKKASLRDLTAAINAGEVDSLVILGGNPVYGAPGDIDFAKALVGVKTSYYHGLFTNETSQLCTWTLPAAHFLEAWGDNVTPNGIVSIQQPLIEPLYSGKSELELILSMLGEPTTAEDAVRAQYPSLKDKIAWQKVLDRGFLDAQPLPAASVQIQMPSSPLPPAGNGDIEAVIIPDPTVWDGYYANNGWMQEMPKPLTKLTWDNAVMISPSTAKGLGVSDENYVNVSFGDLTVKAPVFIQVGHPDGAVTLHMGGDRKHGGRVLHNCGFDFMKFRRESGNVVKVTVAKADGVYPLAAAQTHHSMEGRDIIREGTVESILLNPKLTPEGHDEEELHGLYNLTSEWEAANPDLPQWAMAIDLNYCTGCNACVAACQSENNIPTVGKAEVSRGRELHWIRVDRYYKVTEGTEHRDLDTGSMEAFNFQSPMNNTGSGPIKDEVALKPATISTVFQPVTCQHCEVAPCEPVCPVAATVHSHEGLNQMVYNRCVGTRYCSNNCPYKVRRFNYYNYQHGQTDATFPNNDRRTSDDPLMGKDYGNRNFQGEKDVPLLRLLNNPDVTVRSRGVMEKCTYCVQRINEARITAKKEGKDVAQIEVTTACQQACPTRAITFGNKRLQDSDIDKKRKDPRNYSLLAHVGTVPRTTYLGRVRNPNPLIEKSGGQA